MGREFDLEDRTESFARNVRKGAKALSKNLCNENDGCQVARSSASVDANDIEANEALSKKGLKLRLKACCKEANESGFWLRLNTFGAILTNSE